MLRTFELIMIAAMLIAATITYTIKYDAERQVAAIAKLKRQINAERDTITLLRADWALMTQPGRLQSLTGVYAQELNLAPIEAEQLALGVDEIPERLPDDIEKLIASGEDPAISTILKKDMTATGSIKKSGAGH